jgi:hypothetical protein
VRADRVRLVDSKAGNSGVIQRKKAEELRRQFGGVIEDVVLYVSAHVKHPSVAAVSCPTCKAQKEKPCLGGNGKSCKPHMTRVCKHEPWLSKDATREPCIRVACPTCNSPAWARCVTGANKFTKAHAERKTLGDATPWVDPSAVVEATPPPDQLAAARSKKKAARPGPARTKRAP